MLAAVTASSATLSYNFNDGLQGWTQLDSSGRGAWNSGGNAWGATQSGSIFGYDGDDGAHATYWVRSPAFAIDGSGSLTVRLWGGKANAAAPANVTDVPADAISGAGFKGVVLRDIATGNYVKSLSQTSDGANADYSLTVADLAPYANDGKVYTLDFLDYDYGGWGWVGLDNVTIPGALRQVTLVASVPFVYLSSNSTVLASIPLNLNATVAVTLYVTNSNPSALTVNGSSDPVVPVVFAAGAAPSQNLTVVGTGLGYAQLTGGGAGMVAGSAGVEVVPRSGLIGRWLTGSEDLQDKSGYTPAGTHDGMMPTGYTPVFTPSDVPPGASGSSYDVTTSGTAIIISNSVTTDPGYQPTFDDGTARQLSVAFWAKGLPNTWNPFVSKYGEGSTGWQVRKRGDQPVATFTIRNTGGEDDPFNSSTLIDDYVWHHFAATWDGVAGVRKLYVDGKLNSVVPHDTGSMGLANVNYLTLGGRCGAGSSTPGNVLAGQLFDVQIYGVALSGSAVQSIFIGNTGGIVAYADTPFIDLGRPGSVSISIPASANATTAVTVFVTNTTPAVVSLAGAVDNVLALTFPAGGVPSQMLSLTGLSEGQAQLACAATGLTPTSVAAKVYGPHLIGQWFNGTESYTNGSTFAPAGTHDGIVVGTIGNLTFTADTPPSKPGKAAKFGDGVGLVIGNSSQLDAGYLPTFDDVIGHQFSVAFWAKGLPGTWNAFVSKRGEDANGWQVRRSSGLTEAFTIRGTVSGNEDGVGSVAINDGLWHHYTASWDGWAGTRKCYVDGVLDPSVNLTGDFAPMMMAANHHLVLGARESSGVSANPGIEGPYVGSLYDVRMYNYPLSLIEVSNLSFVAALKVAPTRRSVQAPLTMAVDIVLPADGNLSQAVSVQVNNDTPTLASLVGAVGNVLTLNYPIGSSLTQQVTVAGIADGKARLTATGGGFAAGSGSFNVWADPGSRLIGHWLSGDTNLTETSGFRPAGTHDGVAVGANAGSLVFSSDVPAVAPVGAQSLDFSAGNAAVMITNSSTVELTYVETFDDQIGNKFSLTFWAKGTPNAGDWNPWISKRGEDGVGYQVRRFGGDNPIRPTFTLRGTPGDDDPYINTTVDDVNWHHYAATYDGATGERRLYLDGTRILALDKDFGPFAPASADHLMLGARDYSGFGNYFPGLLYDVRVYSYALGAAEVGALVTPPAAFSLTLGPTNIALGMTVQLVVTLPAGATASSPVTVYLTNNSPSVVTIVGSTGSVYPVTFPVGTLVQVINLQTIGLGQINITAGAAGIGTTGLATVDMVVAPKLIGHWLSGATDLVETSGFRPAGTHDGYAIGGNAAALAFTNDVPAGFSGQSLDLRAGNVGVMVTNTATTDGGYLSTFDDEIAPDFTIVFWAKGFPGDWAPWVSKRGEGGIGWQLRRMGGDPYAGFTVRGLDNDDGTGSTINVNDAPPKWHHFAGVWDQFTGTRALYVDGVLSHVVYNNPSETMSMAPDKHLALGAREGGGTDFEAYFSGLLYDVRVYDYPMSAAEVAAVVTPPAVPRLTVQHWTGNQVRIAWPASFTGYSIEQSSAASGGFGTSGLSVSVEGSENVAYAPTTTSPQFFRLKK